MNTTQLPLSAEQKDDTEKKTVEINPEIFYGRVNHKDILSRLSSEIKSKKFRDVIGLSANKDIKPRHILFAVVKHLLDSAKSMNWHLCKRYDYIYVYNGTFWKQCSKEDVRIFLCDVAIKMGMKEYDARHYEFADKLLKQFLSDAHLPTAEPDANKVLINLNNGTFEFKNSGWQLRDYNPTDFLTYQLPFDYDASAACPLFDKFLKRVQPDENCRIILQEFAGYIFTNLNLEKCLVLLGDGGNGKSVFFKIINALIGRENVLNYSLGSFNHEYYRAKLTNVLLNYSSEKGFELNPDIFKALVSGEPLPAREPYGKPFTIFNIVKFIFNCNLLPRENESTEAYYRRFLIVPFNEKITDAEKDTALADKIIKDELAGVFNWLLGGLKRIIDQQKFTDSVKAEKALTEFRKQSDTVQLFIDEYRFQKSPTQVITLRELYQLYKNFCREDGYAPLGKNKFSQRLESMAFEKTRKNDGYYFNVEKNVL